MICRFRLDITLPLLLAASLWLGTMAVLRVVHMLGQFDSIKPIYGEVVALNDRAPYYERPDMFSLEYPIVKYTDHEGLTRNLASYSGAIPGYFKIGQKVALGRVERKYIILDKWFILSSNFFEAALAVVISLLSYGYYMHWRPRMIAKEKESNQAPEPIRSSVAYPAPQDTRR